MSKRRNLTPQQKVAIVREHLIDGISVSDLYDLYDKFTASPRTDEMIIARTTTMRY